MTTIHEKVSSIVSSMTLKKMVSQMVHGARGISRLKIPTYVWWNECRHGVGQVGVASDFPQPIGLVTMLMSRSLKELLRQFQMKIAQNTVNEIDRVLSKFLINKDIKWCG